MGISTPKVFPIQLRRSIAERDINGISGSRRSVEIANEIEVRCNKASPTIAAASAGDFAAATRLPVSKCRTACDAVVSRADGPLPTDRDMVHVAPEWLRLREGDLLQVLPKRRRAKPDDVLARKRGATGRGVCTAMQMEHGEDLFHVHQLHLGRLLDPRHAVRVCHQVPLVGHCAQVDRNAELSLEGSKMGQIVLIDVASILSGKRHSACNTGY